MTPRYQPQRHASRGNLFRRSSRATVFELHAEGVEEETLWQRLNPFRRRQRQRKFARYFAEGGAKQLRHTEAIDYEARSVRRYWTALLTVITLWLLFYFA